MFISSEPRHPGRSVLPTVWLTWGGFGGGQSSRFPLGDCSSAPPSCALASLLQKEILLPHPQDGEWDRADKAGEGTAIRRLFLCPVESSRSGTGWWLWGRKTWMDFSDLKEVKQTRFGDR